MNHVMVDIETMGASSKAAIVAIGAVKFDPYGKEDAVVPGGHEDDRFYTLVNLASCMTAGLQVDASTIMWWLQQSEQARKALDDGEQIQMVLKDALKAFSDWFKGATFIWGHGATFDPVILWNAYESVKLWAPWKFRDVRDTRTLFDLAGPDIPKFESPHAIAHHALHDAIRQAMQVQWCYGKLKGANG